MSIKFLALWPKRSRHKYLLYWWATDLRNYSIFLLSIGQDGNWIEVLIDASCFLLIDSHSLVSQQNLWLIHEAKGLFLG
jgi:hypothetical protein